MTSDEIVISDAVLNMHTDMLQSVLNNLKKFISESESDSFDKDNYTDGAIITAAFVMAINRLKEIYPNVDKAIIETIQSENKKSLN